MTYSDLSANPRYYVHHVAYARGYVSAKVINPLAVEYNGRFGRGYYVLTHNSASTRYCNKIYYIEKENS